MDAARTLLEAVLAEPESDAHRLAYAAGVERSEPDRAELVRVQVELTRRRRTGAPVGDSLDLYRRQRQLLNARGAAWAGAILGHVQSHIFFRGFVEEIGIAAEAFLARTLELYRLAPILHLDLSSAAKVVPALFAAPALARLRSLSLGNGRIGDDGVRALAASPHLARLTWLDLSGNDIGDAGLEALAASPNLPGLRYLDFANNRCADPTPQIAGEDAVSGTIHAIEVPELGRELVARHGPRAWLAPLDVPYPPARDALF